VVEFNQVRVTQKQMVIKTERWQTLSHVALGELFNADETEGTLSYLLSLKRLLLVMDHCQDESSKTRNHFCTTKTTNYLTFDIREFVTKMILQDLSPFGTEGLCELCVHSY
jgi:hypothetical protein